MPRPGGRPARAANAATCGASSARIAFATATPSSVLADMRLRLVLELLQRVGSAEHHELVARPHHRLRFGVEFHLAVLPLDADHNHAEPVAQVRIDDGM